MVFSPSGPGSVEVGVKVRSSLSSDGGGVASRSVKVSDEKGRGKNKEPMIDLLLDLQVLIGQFFFKTSQTCANCTQSYSIEQ